MYVLKQHGFENHSNRIQAEELYIGVIPAAGVELPGRELMDKS